MSKKNETDGLSALMEIKPSETDDRTCAIDLQEIKNAHREAKAVARRSRKLFTLGRVLQFLVLVGLLGGGGFVATQPELKSKVLALFSASSHIQDISTEDQEALNTAIKASIETDGPKLKAVHSKAGSSSPTFYLGTNLPEGFSFDIYLLGKLGQVLSKTLVEVRLPILVEKGIAKTPALHVKNAATLPSGLYDVTIFESEEQTEITQGILSKLPEVTGLPASIPKGRKIFYSEKAFLGEFSNESDAQFTSQIAQIRQELRGELDKEFQSLKSGIEFFDGLFQSTTQIGNDVLGHSTVPAAKKKWADFHQQWKVDHPVLNGKGAAFSVQLQAIKVLQQELQDFHALQNQQMEGQVKVPPIPQQLNEKGTVIQQKLSDLKAWLKATETALANPTYFPSASTP